jgi:hypothetical protein
MWRPFETPDRRYALRPQLATLLGPSGLQIPVSTFDGDVRRVAIDNASVRVLFEAAFPAFKADEKYYRNADLISGRYRRYSGADTLARGSYSSVCRSDGSEPGGLVREIFAYAWPEETGIVLIDDMSEPDEAFRINRRYGSQFEQGPYFLVFCAEPERIVPREWQGRANISNFFAVPYITEHRQIENVIDLRLPVVQEWFFEVFSKEEWLNIHVPLPEMHSFLELLPLLVGQRRGGNALTQAVGRELRLWGVGGLVYPSARCDCADVVDEGEVVDWYGWNLVEYSVRREDTFNPFDASTVTQMLDFADDIQHGNKFFEVPIGEMVVRHSTEARQRGTWQVVGLEALNVRAWKRRLNTAQRELLGLPPNNGLDGGEEGFHEVEKRFRDGFRTVVESGDLGLDVDRVRHLLARVARALMEIPGGSGVAVSREKMGQIIGDQAMLPRFERIATAAGVLIEEAPGYFRFADRKTFEYFTAIP